MDEYYCECCRYATSQLSHFKSHMKSKKHINNNGNTNDINTEPIDYKDFKRKVFRCKICDAIYLSKQKLTYHLVKCIDENESKKEKEKIENKLKKEKEESEREKKRIEKELKKSKEQIKKLEKKIQDKDDRMHEIQLKDREVQLKDKEIQLKDREIQMSIIKYVKLNYPDSIPLEELTGDDIYKVIKYKNPKKDEDKNEIYVKNAIFKNDHGNFANFIGDMIIDYYKPKTKKETNVIATDVYRSCFIIMQKVTDKNNIEKKEWISDKSGEKFTKLVLMPVMNAVKETLSDFVKFKKDIIDDYDKIMGIMGKCGKLIRDINVNKFTKPILKHVASSFHFDKLKFLNDDCEDIESDSNESIETKPKKIIKIKVKKN